MSRVLALFGDQSAIYQSYLGKVILPRPEAVRQKTETPGIRILPAPAPGHRLLLDTDIDLPVSRSADLHRRNIEYCEMTSGQNALRPGLLFTVHRVLVFVGGGANNHNLLQEGCPFIMRLRQFDFVNAVGYEPR
jgi:hypothetical protein